MSNVNWFTNKVPGLVPSPIRDGPKDRTSDVQLHIGESLDSGFDTSRRPGMTTWPSIINPDRPDLDRTIAGAGNPRGDGEGRVEILGLDQVIAAKLLAGFRERTIGSQGLAVADANGG